MCTASSPKVDQSAVDAQNKKPQYLRNPWLDGLAIQGSGETSGRNSLVIAPGTTAPPPTSQRAPTLSNPSYTSPNTNLGLGAGGGFNVGGGGFGIGRAGIGIAQR